MFKKQLKFIITIILVLGFSISLQSLIASWQAPSANPPGSNLDKPINDGDVAQTKSGSFTTSSDLGVAGNSILSQNLTVNGEVYSNVLNNIDSSLNLDAKGMGMNFTIDNDNNSSDSYRFYGNGSEVMSLSDTGNLDVSGKITTAQTLGTDTNDTVATKKYVDDSVGGGSCSFGPESSWSACDAPGSDGLCHDTQGNQYKTRILTCSGVPVSVITSVKSCNISWCCTGDPGC